LNFLIILPSSEVCITFLLSDSCHEMRKQLPDFLRENQCCVGGMDFITMIFTLSAIPFAIMPSTIEQCVSVLKQGGLLLFRDYGLYDMTMLRFLPHQRVGFREYMRSDGTLSYFFTLDTVRELFHAAGLITLELEYCCVRSVNRKNGKKMQRVWVHGKFMKPTSWRWQTVNVVFQQTATALAILATGSESPFAWPLVLSS